MIHIRERGQWEQDREGRRDGTEAMAPGERIEDIESPNENDILARPDTNYAGAITGA